MGVRQFSAQSRACIAALVFGVSGSIVAYLILPAGRSDWHPLAVSSGVAAFGVSLLFWRIFCASDQLISGRRGALVGVLTGGLAHPLAWYLTIVWSYASGAKSSLGDRMLNPLEGLAACFVYAGFSVVLTGWLTVPAGGIVGWVLGKVLRARQAGGVRRTN
jgi:hypothetical protein